MELTDAMRRRRMVRAFTGRPVEPAVLDHLLVQACRAPSAGNTGGWDLVVLQGDQTATFWGCTTTNDWRRRSRRWPGLAAAPVVVVLVCDPAAYASRYRLPDKTGSGLGDEQAWPVPYWFVDAGMATMALLLGATDAGLGACFLGNFRGEDALLLALGVPAGRRYVGAVVLGEPAEHDPPSASLTRGRRHREQVVHPGRW